jgi:hypothetical protein
MGAGIKTTGDADVVVRESGHWFLDVPTPPTAQSATGGALFNRRVGTFSTVTVQRKLLKWVPF